MIEFYFPDNNNELYKNTSKNEKMMEEINNKLKLKTVREHLYNDSIFTIKDCSCRNIIFESLSDKMHIKYNLENIYNNIEKS